MLYHQHHHQQAHHRAQPQLLDQWKAPATRALTCLTIDLGNEASWPTAGLSVQRLEFRGIQRLERFRPAELQELPCFVQR